MGRDKPLGVTKQTGKKFQYKTPKSQRFPDKLALGREENLANLFQDKRFGAQNPNMSDEAKYLKRFTRERQFLSKRKGKFELDEEEEFVLTHKGEALDAVQDMDHFSVQSDDPSDFEDSAVQQLHFSSEGPHSDSKPARQRYEEIIAKSKYNKYLHKKNKEDLQVLALQTDQNTDNLRKVMKFRDFDQDKEKDEYDLLVNELRDEGKQRPATDNAYEQALQARQELEKAGKKYEVPENYEEFESMFGSNQGETLAKLMVWNDQHLPSAQGKLPLLLSHVLRYLADTASLSALLTQGQYSPLLTHTHSLCCVYPETTCELLTALIQSPLSATNSVILLDLMGCLAAISDLNDENNLTIRAIAGENLLKTNTKLPEKCCFYLFFAYIYAYKWVFPSHVFTPELFFCVRRVLIRTKDVSPSECTLKELIISPNYEKARFFTEKLLISAFKAFPGPQFRLFFQELIAISPSKLLQKSFKSVFSVSGPEKPLQVEKITEIPTYEPLIFDHITTLHKAKDPHKTETDTKRLKLQLKTAKKEAKKALQRENFADELKKQEENRLNRLERERKGHKAQAVLEDLQREYKRTVTSQKTEERRKQKRKRMAGNEMEQTS